MNSVKVIFDNVGLSEISKSEFEAIAKSICNKRRIIEAVDLIYKDIKRIFYRNINTKILVVDVT